MDMVVMGIPGADTVTHDSLGRPYELVGPDIMLHEQVFAEIAAFPTLVERSGQARLAVLVANYPSYRFCQSVLCCISHELRGSPIGVRSGPGAQPRILQ
jgi:hypothetical protein